MANHIQVLFDKIVSFADKLVQGLHFRVKKVFEECQCDEKEVLPGLVVAAGGCGQAAKCCDEIGILIK